jgi:arylsulfatase A-like enzyme
MSLAGRPVRLVVAGALGLGLVALGLTWVLRSAGTSERPIPTGPNILLILTDDQRASGTLEVMPRTRHWFEDGGVRFPSAFVTTPLCCPSRASILTGQFAHNHGILFHVTPRLHVTSPDSPFQRATIERALHDAGYETALFGKYLNGWPESEDPPFFDTWSVVRVPRKDTYFGGEVNEDGNLRPMNEYNTTYLRDRALDFLRSMQGDARPWFLSITVKAPHYPYTPEPKYENAPVPPLVPDPAMQETDRSDKPPDVQQRSVSPEKAEMARTAQLRTLMSVDDLVESVFQELTRLGEVENTLALFTSDNGLLWGEHGLGVNKLVPYTPSVAVPLLLRWPGHVAAGVVDDRLAANVDLAPTILQAAGISPGPSMSFDGRSLLEPSHRSRLLLEYGSTGGWASTRTRDFQYVEYYDNGQVTFREYYDLRADPWQLTNLLADDDTANDPDVTALSAQLTADRGCRESACP